MRERVARKAEGLDVPVIVIPNWSDLEAIEPSDKGSNKLLQNLGIQEKFVLMYAGNIGHPTDIQTIVLAADKVREDSEIHFIFVGSGAKLGWLEREVAKRGLINISILGQRPREEQNEFLNACDVGLISLTEGMLGTAMPSRTYNILAAGKAIIALTEHGSELATVITEERVGWYTPPGDPAALVELIESAKHDPELAEKGQLAREAAEQKYSPFIAVDRYREVVRLR